MLSLYVHCLVFSILHCIRRCYCQMRTAERNKAPRWMLRKALPLLTEHGRGALSRRLFCSARTFFSIKLMLSPHPTFFSCLEPRGLAFNERYRPFQYQTRTRILDFVFGRQWVFKCAVQLHQEPTRALRNGTHLHTHTVSRQCSQTVHRQILRVSCLPLERKTKYNMRTCHYSIAQCGRGKRSL